MAGKGNKMLTPNDAREMDKHSVKRLYLSVVAMMFRLFSDKLIVSMESGSLLRISGTIEQVRAAIKYAIAQYAPVMTITDHSEKTPPHFFIGRNMVVTVDGNTRKSSENNATVKDRQRIGAKGSKNYAYHPLNMTIHGIDKKDASGKGFTEWIVKDKTGKTLTTCRVLFGEAFPYCEELYRQSLIKK
jgi:hypothetical protein